MAGYLVLVFCLAFIIRLVHEELGKKSAMEQQETHWQGERRETNRAFLHLLDLAATGELIAGWTEDDYAAYRKKRIATVNQLQELKPLQEDAAQRAAIDSVCNLLVEKERLMPALLSTLENTPDVEEIVHRKIPALLPKSRKETTLQPAPRPCCLEEEKELLELSEPEEREIRLCPATGKGVNEHRYTPAADKCHSIKTFGLAPFP